ncbi:hypothetical protein [Azospirillum agricola]|uniref:hypothetical protein n=1 Tax=Azospirillum agricola TaxID=1720247 RepID=UPI000A0F23D7|nr:hypothetical protein [Azospirillum agricola]SMH60660.1 hypothetical protein SAMN02982994_5680 [Azospirillum lipoferum]
MPRPTIALCLGVTMALALPSGAKAQAAPGGPVILGQPITLNLGAPAAGADCPAAAAGLNAQGLLLVANGQTIPGAHASFGCSAKGEVVGTASTSIAGNSAEAVERRAAWQNAFDGFFSLARAKSLPVAFGPAGGGVATPPKLVTIQGASDRDLTLAAVCFALIGLLFLLAFLRHFGRDAINGFPDVPKPAGYVPPYSLSRFQLLWWSGIVTASYAALIAVIGSMDTVSTGTMALMGIVGGTSVLAVFQDNRPSGDDDHRQQHRAAYLAAAQADPPDRARMAAAVAAIYPLSEGVLTDLLTDVHGYNIHRLQLLAWTVVLGAAFLYEATRTLGMPELSANLLALTGISNGTYFGFKMQEQQVEPPAQPLPPSPAVPVPVPAG